ncbi:MAG: LutB/LldF family L-lactate oxidation iron-sulfur protein [Verrucomicrobiota bacterium]
MNTAQQFSHAAAAKATDLRHRAIIQKNISSYDIGVARGKDKFADWQNARSSVAAIKWDTINHLDRYLKEFERNVLANGGHVHWAEDAEQARQIVLTLARQHGVRKVVKAKSMTTEEIHLNPALEAAGIQPVETDLGEYICQLRGEPPYHIVTPVMHLSKADIGKLFHERFGTPPDAPAEELTMVARRQLRQDFLTADMGITGANFLIADTGMIALTTNEGNGRLSVSLPRIHVVIAGIEKLIPRLSDLGLFWPVLCTSGTGQALTSYSTLVGGPRRDGEPDGPAEFHVILLDNGRTKLLANPEMRDVLHCIRCGACLNTCPVYKTIGGHTYATTYQGPIGSVLTPRLRGAEEWSHLSFASSLCGSCTDVCPVRIDLHHHLLHNRRDAIAGKLDNPFQRLAFKLWLWILQSPARYVCAGKLARLGMRLGLGNSFAKPWTATRDLPEPPRQSFRDWWRHQPSPMSTDSGPKTQDSGLPPHHP